MSAPFEPMDGAEVRAVIDALGLTQSDAARFLGVTDRQVRKWCAYAVDGASVRGTQIPEATAMLLRFMTRRGVSRAEVEAAAYSTRSRG